MKTSNIIRQLTEGIKLSGTNSNDMLIGLEGSDTLIGGAGEDQLSGSEGSNVINEISGTVNNDNLSGTNGNDLIRGLQGRDTLIGNAGDDILIGGLDGDLLTGGEGIDQFVFDSLSERTDRITDFNVNEDLLVLTNLFAEISYDGIDAIADGYLRFVQNGSDTKVQVDEDSIDGSSPFRTIATLENVTVADLVVGSNVII